MLEGLYYRMNKGLEDHRSILQKLGLVHRGKPLCRLTQYLERSRVHVSPHDNGK